jgi:hypothetical protein
MNLAKGSLVSCAPLQERGGAANSDVLRFVLPFLFRSLGIFRSLPSDKLVSQTSRLGMGPALPTFEAFRNAGVRVLLVRPFAALV